MLIAEALEVLALKPGATASEVKEAYRDLVKVWHPDRFGTDLRLRQKAELQLQLINEAYRVLQSAPGDGGIYAAGSDTSYPRYSSPSPAANGHPRRFLWNVDHARVVWIYLGLGTLAILLAVYLVIERGVGSSPDSVPQSQQTHEPDGQTAPSPDSTAAKVRPKGLGRSKEPGPRDFRVRSLSVTQTDRLETLCSPQKELRGQVAYQWCLKAQLDLMTNPAGSPDLSALRQAERESIESVCSAVRGGSDRYNRCATEQVASLAAEPARPDLSTLNNADRLSIEAACAHAKDRQGPATYNRCLDGFMKTLAQAR